MDWKDTERKIIYEDVNTDEEETIPNKIICNRYSENQGCKGDRVTGCLAVEAVVIICGIFLLGYLQWKSRISMAKAISSQMALLHHDRYNEKAAP